MNMKRVQLISSKSEIGAGTRGASMGFDAMRIASLNKGSNYFEGRSIAEVPNENELLFSIPEPTRAKNIGGVQRLFDNFSKVIGPVLRSDSFPLVIAGDHSSASATVAAIKKEFPEKRLGVIWIDAHADLHSPYTTPSGNMHGMPLAISLGLDNETNSVSGEVPEDIRSGWNELKAWGGIQPKVNPSDLVFIAVRDTEEPEDRLMDELGIKRYSVRDVKEQGVDSVVLGIEQYLSECDHLYISFDVDSMDCDIVSHGTGTPVPNGLTPDQANNLLLGLLKNEKVSCLEFTEVNPTLDEKKNKMADTAFEILENCTRLIEEGD
jgi:arginase